MKKMRTVLALLMLAGFSQAALSATLTWGNKPVGSTVTLDQGSVISASFGFGPSLVGDIFSHSYSFKSTSIATVLLRMIELPHENIDVTKITYDGIAMTFDSFNQRWFGNGANSLEHTIQIMGSVDRAGTAYLLTADSSVSNVPVPAAIWLFGSAFAGLIGVSKRKMGAKTQTV
jgi:hypothetical protein